LRMLKALLTWRLACNFCTLAIAFLIARAR